MSEKRYDDADDHDNAYSVLNGSLSFNPVTASSIISNVYNILNGSLNNERCVSGRKNSNIYNILNGSLNE